MFHHFWQLNWLHIVYNFLFKFLLADSLFGFNNNGWLYGLLFILWLFHFLYWLIVIILDINYVVLANRLVTTVDNIDFVLCTWLHDDFADCRHPFIVGNGWAIDFVCNYLFGLAINISYNICICICICICVSSSINNRVGIIVLIDRHYVLLLAIYEWTIWDIGLADWIILWSIAINLSVIRGYFSCWWLYCYLLVKFCQCVAICGLVDTWWYVLLVGILMRLGSDNPGLPVWCSELGLGIQHIDTTGGWVFVGGYIGHPSLSIGKSVGLFCIGVSVGVVVVNCILVAIWVVVNVSLLDIVWLLVG